MAIQEPKSGTFWIIEGRPDMGRPLRAAAGGVIYHVLNRANARRPIFEKTVDFEAFERVLGDAYARVATRILGYCIMPNHWHLVLWPSRDGELTQFMAWLTLTHTQRWHAHHQSAGAGHLYQGRFKSFPVQADDHFLTVCRYVERNALRAGLVARAEDWRWSSLWYRNDGKHSTPAWLVPNRAAAELDGLGEPTADGRRVGVSPRKRATRPAIRLRQLGTNDG
jgi:putative transposase